MEHNFLYCISRGIDLKEFKNSLKSITSLYDKSSYNICVYYNFNLDLKDVIDYIDIALPLPNRPSSFLDKIYSIANCPYNKFLWLDCDTYLLEKLDDLFALNERFEISVAYASNGINVSYTDVPDSFLEFNTGTILIKRNVCVNSFLFKWYEEYTKQSFKMHDQPSFRRCLYKSNVNFYVFDHSFNCRFTQPNFVYNRISILHGRSKKLEQIIQEAKRDNLRKKPFRQWIKKY